MVIVRLYGGLGNQMFQYACGKALALRSGQELLLDTSWYKTYHQGIVNRPLELSVFPHIQIRESEPLGFFRSNRFQHVYRLAKALHIDYERKILNVYHEDHDFLLKDFQAPFQQNYYLNGYWQSEQYFSDIADEIRHDFSFPDVTDQKNKDFISFAASTDRLVSLHVRHGDYITNAAAAAKIGALPLSYYQNAIQFVKERDPDLRFVVFSDDIPWCKNELPLFSDTVFVDWNQGQDSFRDMQLMCACTHHIVANSSFSWWGAWLGSHPHGLTIAPAHWSRSRSQAELFEQNIVPVKWNRV